MLLNFHPSHALLFWLQPTVNASMSPLQPGMEGMVVIVGVGVGKKSTAI